MTLCPEEIVLRIWKILKKESVEFRPWCGEVGVEPWYGKVGVGPWYGEVGVEPWYGKVGVRPWCEEVGVPTMVWRSWSSDHGVEKREF